MFSEFLRYETVNYGGFVFELPRSAVDLQLAKLLQRLERPVLESTVAGGFAVVVGLGPFRPGVDPVAQQFNFDLCERCSFRRHSLVKIGGGNAA